MNPIDTPPHPAAADIQESPPARPAPADDDFDDIALGERQPEVCDLGEGCNSCQ